VDATDAAEDDDKGHIDLGILVVKLLKVRLMPRQVMVTMRTMPPMMT
jgi:hypothetical protein